ncbi:hypothetical protein MCERE19_02280 [Spirosomataceae bacterium]|jgi:hypothetical protein
MWKRLDSDGKFSVVFYLLFIVVISVWGLGFGKLEIGAYLAYVVAVGFGIMGEISAAYGRVRIEIAEKEVAILKEQLREADDMLTDFDIQNEFAQLPSFLQQVEMKYRYKQYKEKYHDEPKDH